MTVDDLGVNALDLNLLEVIFERKIDYDRFLENVSSIALVPLRDDTVDFEPDTCAMSSGDPISLTLLSNGPFSIKQLDYNRGAMLERSVYYRLEGKRGENILKFVRPYRIVLDFSRSLEAQVDSFVTTNNTVAASESNIFFLGDVPSARFDEFRSDTEVKDMLSAYSVHFNANRAPFNRPEVRQALSIALDRNHIAGIAGRGVKPAAGIVPVGIVGESARGADFRTESPDLIVPGGDMNAARSLLSAAGNPSGSIELKVRNDERTGGRELAIANYIAGVWKDLGFNVAVVPAQGRQYAEDIFGTNYDAMLFDFQAAGVNAWSVLAPFAMAYSGSAKVYNPDGGFYEDEPFITGFQDNAYDALIEEIFLLDDNKDRYAKLQQAERMLVELSPIAPLYFNTSVNITEKITGISYSRFGFPMFTRATLRNHQEYTTTDAPREFLE
jgi:ABC-type oligopeptide transport system substrate-binding subunit